MIGSKGNAMPETAGTIVTVKVQLPVYPVDETSLAMIYDEGREHVQVRKLDEAELRLIRKRIKTFCAAWWSDATGWVLLERVPDKRW
jgi:hypothetical protein